MEIIIMKSSESIDWNKSINMGIYNVDTNDSNLLIGYHLMVTYLVLDTNHC